MLKEKRPMSAEPRDKDAEIYPCARCGVMRSENQGGRIFTVCDECWDVLHPKRKS